MPSTSPQQPSRIRRKQRGFTLIELMVVVTLLGVFAAIAIPNFTQFIDRSRTQSLNNELVALLQFARTAAVEQRTYFRACKETGAWTVKKTCTTSADTLRRLDIPNTVTVTPVPSSIAEIAFRYNGTAADARLVTCRGTDYANGFTIDIKATGSIQSWPRGKNSATTNMSACDK